jgi:ElaB/YqjD/DUF883 family membrane-anchored ribosome-binding protein
MSRASKLPSRATGFYRFQGLTMDKTSSISDTSSMGTTSIDKGTDTAHATVSRVSSVAHATVDKLADSATRVAEKLSEKTQGMKDAPTQALEFSKSWVQEKPLEAVGAALAIGFLLGRLTGR